MKVFIQKIQSSAIADLNLTHFADFEFFSDLSEKPSIQVKQRHFYEIMLFDTHSAAYLPPLTILKKFKFFPKNIFKKTVSSAYVFGELYCFSCIPPQIC